MDTCNFDIGSLDLVLFDGDTAEDLSFLDVLLQEPFGDLDLIPSIQETGPNQETGPKQQKQPKHDSGEKENQPTIGKESECQKQPTFLEVDKEQKDLFIQQMRNSNTVKKTQGAIRQFERWLSAPPRNETRKITELPVVELDNHIGLFLLSIRKSDGSEYEPDTLTSYHRGIDRYLRESCYPHSILQDREFRTSRAVLCSKRKELKMNGKGNRPNAAQPLTDHEKQTLTEKQCVGTASPNQLLNKLWLNNTMMFGLRGGTENRTLKWGDVQLKMDSTGTEFLEFNERCTKTRTGETSNDQRSFKPKQFAHVTTEDCPVHAYKEYRSRRPQATLADNAPFYLAINYKRKDDTDIWYKNQPLGENSLRNIMKNMATKANLPGRKTNHSARKTTVTDLLHKGVAPTTIQQLTGHKNVQSINNYAVASNEMQKSMSNILSSKSTSSSTSMVQMQAPKAPQPLMNMSSTQWNSSSTRESSAVSGQLMSNAVLHNCQIIINNDYGSGISSPKPKRRRIIESDSDDN